MITRLNVLFTGGIVLVVASCTQGPRIDLEAERSKLLEADHAFAAETTRLGGDGWANFFAPDGVMLPISGGRVDGQEAIRKRMMGAFGGENPRLLWEPTEAVVSAGGELGYTLGRWRSVASGATGQDSVLATGNYVTIWRKEADQGWRVAVDAGNQDPAPVPPR